MGFWDKLFYGASKRFANDVSRGVVKEQSKDNRVKDKIHTFNAVSKDYYARVNFVRDMDDLMGYIFDNLLQEEMDVTLDGELQNKLVQYCEKYGKELQSLPPVPLSGHLAEQYQRGLASFEKAYETISVFVDKRTYTFNNRDRSEEYVAKIRELGGQLMQGQITKQQYKEMSKAILPDHSNEPKDKRSFVVLRQDTLNHFSQFSTIGEQVLNKLK
jgi:hypothetical protein